MLRKRRHDSAQRLDRLPGGGSVHFWNCPRQRERASDNVGVSKVWFFLDGVNVGTDTLAAFSWSFDTLTTANGAHTIMATAFDTIGNSSSTAISVTVANPDVSSPTVTMTSPAALAQLAGSFQVSATASDNIGVSSVQFLVDGVVALTDLSPPYDGALTTVGLLDGNSHVLAARAFDAAGNSQFLDRVRVLFVGHHRCRPSRSHRPLAAAAPLRSFPDFTATAIGQRRGQHGSIHDRRRLPVVIDHRSLFDQRLNTVNFSSGTHLLAARAFDPAGNSSTGTVSVTFSPDTAGCHAAQGRRDGLRVRRPPERSRGPSGIGVRRRRRDPRRTCTWMENCWRRTTPRPSDFKLDTSALGTGPHVAMLKAYDAAGNSSTTTAGVHRVASFSVGAFQPLFNPMRGESVTIPLNLAQTMHVEARLLDRFGSLVATLVRRRPRPRRGAGLGRTQFLERRLGVGDLPPVSEHRRLHRDPKDHPHEIKKAGPACARPAFLPENHRPFKVCRPGGNPLRSAS